MYASLMYMVDQILFLVSLLSDVENIFLVGVTRVCLLLSEEEAKMRLTLYALLAHIGLPYKLLITLIA